LRLIARAEQCTKGLTSKLEKRGFSSGCISEVIIKLTEQNLLNDSRFAVFWLRSRLRFARTPRRLLASLCAKGISSDIIQAAIETVLDEDTEFAMLERFAKKNARKKNKKCENTIQTLKHLFKSEGFSRAVIQRFLEE